MASREYGRKGLLGVLTPQANTTVEPELWSLLPGGWSMLNARLVSDKPSIEERLVDYTGKFSATAERFANAPVDVLGAACTGASYLIGADAEARIVEDMESRFKVPFITAALASVAALRQLGARRIALLTPYPESLNRHSTPYWQGHGFDIVAKAGPALETDRFHPIYAMQGAGVLEAYRKLSQSNADAVLMLGTGMATLGPILTGKAEGLIPAISCNLAFAWAATQAKSWTCLEHNDLEGWIGAEHWRRRYDALFASTGQTA